MLNYTQIIDKANKIQIDESNIVVYGCQKLSGASSTITFTFDSSMNFITAFHCEKQAKPFMQHYFQENDIFLKSIAENFLVYLMMQHNFSPIIKQIKLIGKVVGEYSNRRFAISKASETMFVTYGVVLTMLNEAGNTVNAYFGFEELQEMLKFFNTNNFQDHAFAFITEGGTYSFLTNVCASDEVSLNAVKQFLNDTNNKATSKCLFSLSMFGVEGKGQNVVWQINLNNKWYSFVK